MNGNSRQRILYLDVAKVSVMFLVVFAHLYSGDSDVRLYIYSFHMPLYFIISGMFYRFDGTVQIHKYVRTLLVPAIFFILLFDIIMVVPFHLGYDIRWHEAQRGDNVIQTFWNVINFGREENITKISGNPVCWFLIALFWCKVFTDFIKKKYYYYILGILLLSVGLAYFFQDSIFFIIQGFIALPFYYIGYKFKDTINTFLKDKNSSQLLLIAFLCFALNIYITTINGRVSVFGHHFGSLHVPINILVFYLNACVGSIGVFCLSSMLRIGKSMMQKLSNSLISIVGLQALFVYSYESMFGFDQPFVISTIATILIMVLCYLCHVVIVQICPQIIGKRK